VLIACWSVKGGSGTTVTAAALSVALANGVPDRRRRASGVVLVDLGGDLPAALGVPEPSGPGVCEWLSSADADADALARLLHDVRPGLHLLPFGSGPMPTTGGERLALALGGMGSVVVDCGAPGSPVGLAVAGSAALSLLVLRPCYLALRRALRAPLKASGVIFIDEPGRALGVGDVEDVLGLPVRAVVPHHDGISRSVDAGLLAARLPRQLERAVRSAA
jgi:hypothetical protein